MDGDADIAAVASVMGHAARGTMLVALLAGRSLPAGELAQVAGVSRSTASGHLSQLATVTPRM
jgi:DNA-binding transcriptional ArsR family regulator